MSLIVITGASQGIGQAIAERFAQEPGARVALLARTGHRLEEVAERCRSFGAEALVCPCDVTDDESVHVQVGRILEWGGAPRALVNNAGLFRPGRLVDTRAAEFRAQVAVNLTSAFVVTRAFLDSMIRQQGGHIFFMASVASLRGYAGGAAYCAAKHGLLGLARVVREELKSHGIRVTSLLPGPVRTPSWNGTDFPDERFMAAADIAESVVDVFRLGNRTVVEEVLLRPQLGDL